MSNNFKSLTFQVDSWVKETKERMNDVARGSVKDLIDIAQVPEAQGGKMPVDTGFLRSTGRAELNKIPSGNGINPTTTRPPNERGNIIYNYKAENTDLTIARMKIGDKLIFGYIAVYASKLEFTRGFLRSALSRWSAIVRKNIIELKRDSR